MLTRLNITIDEGRRLGNEVSDKFYVQVMGSTAPALRESVWRKLWDLVQSQAYQQTGMLFRDQLEESL